MQTPEVEFPVHVISRPKPRRGRPATGKGETLYIPQDKLDQVKKILEGERINNREYDDDDSQSLNLSGKGKDPSKKA